MAKRSTRDELIARVSAARDFLHATHGSKADLDTLAEVACLSRYHFLRLFRELSGTTPAAYARSLRLQRARSLLQAGRSLSSARRAAGYGNAKAFARAYYREFGTPLKLVQN